MCADGKFSSDQTITDLAIPCVDAKYVCSDSCTHPWWIHTSSYFKTPTRFILAWGSEKSERQKVPEIEKYEILRDNQCMYSMSRLRL